MDDNFLGDLLDGFLSDIVAMPTPHLGQRFNEYRAREAHNLVRRTAVKVNRAEHSNTVGMFPRVTVHEHRDLDMLRLLAANHAAELRDMLLQAAGSYALGGQQHSRADLEQMAGDYETAARLAEALEVDHKRLLNWEASQKLAENKAYGAYNEMDARRNSEETPGYDGPVNRD